jgi:hypothetical protein
MAADACAVVAACASALEHRLRPHVARAESHLGEGCLPLSSLITVDAKPARALRKALLLARSDARGVDARGGPTPSTNDLIVTLRETLRAHGATRARRVAVRPPTPRPLSPVDDE